MAAAKSFFEVLRDQVKSDLREEIVAEIRAEYGPTAQTEGPAFEKREAKAAELFETWMAANVESSFFNRSFNSQTAYKAPTAARRYAKTEPARAREVVRKTASSAAELLAVETLRRESGTALLFTFSHDELRTAWKKAALKTHPDRFAQAEASVQDRAKARFQELVEAHAILEAMF